MRYLNSGSKINTAILILFLAAWLYTEITEHIKRQDFVEEIQAYLSSGNRHDTALKNIEERLDALELDQGTEVK